MLNIFLSERKLNNLTKALDTFEGFKYTSFIKSRTRAREMIKLSSNGQILKALNDGVNVQQVPDDFCMTGFSDWGYRRHYILTGTYVTFTATLYHSTSTLFFTNAIANVYQLIEQGRIAELFELYGSKAAS